MTAIVGAAGLGAFATPNGPAAARVVVDIGVPLGVPYYVPPPVYYYPAPVVSYGGCGWAAHWVPAHWTRWGRWVPGHCRPNR